MPIKDMKKINTRVRLFICNNRWLYSLFYPIYSKYMTPGLVLKKQNHMLNHAEDLLKNLDNSLKKLKVSYWLDCGTLLGLIRENGFISHDIDIDIGILLDDFTPSIEAELQNNGFKLVYKYELIDSEIKGLEHTYEYKGINLDIFFYRLSEKKKCCHYFITEEGKSRDFTINKYGGLLVAQMCVPHSGVKSIKFLKRSFKIPVDYRGHLRAIYGDNYMTPNPKWKADMSRYEILDGMIAQFKKYD